MINRRHCERVANLLEDDDTVEILAGGVVDLDDKYSLAASMCCCYTTPLLIA